MSTYVAPLPTGGPRLSPLDLEIKEFITFLQIEVIETEAMKFDPLNDRWTENWTYGGKWDKCFNI